MSAQPLDRVSTSTVAAQDAPTRIEPHQLVEASEDWSPIEARLRRGPYAAGMPTMSPAAGTWRDVFGIEPRKLVKASEGLVTDSKRG